jgi:ABC-type branched-subunit amino acid transport system ATPase component
LLRVEDINVAYGSATVLHDVSLNVNKGETVFIVGRNGAGKTTLLKTICGLMKPAKGKIEYMDQNTCELDTPKLAKRGLRFVAQDKKVFGDLTVRENIELAAYACKEDLKKSTEKVTEIYPKINDFLDMKSDGLSGGQREILLIGRAMVGNPNLLLIDEPTEGLAVIVINDIFRIIKNQIKELNISALIVEQNLSIVKNLADRIYIMKEGHIIKEIDNRRGCLDVSELETYL